MQTEQTSLETDVRRLRKKSGFLFLIQQEDLIEFFISSRNY